MPRYSASPQRPGEVGTPFRNPNRIDVIVRAESIILGSRDTNPDHIDLRDTCREFLGYDVATLRRKPREGCQFCDDCGFEKELKDFYPDARRVLGVRGVCRACDNDARQARRKRRLMRLYQMSV